MPLVGPRMHGNALRAETLQCKRRSRNVGKIASARIANNRNLVYVDT